MGYDITMHPFSTREFNYYFDDVLLDDKKIDSRLQDIHTDEGERTFLKDAIYSRLAPLKSQTLSGELEFENGIGFGMCAIFGFLHPYWYSRNGLLTKLFQFEALKLYLGTIADLASDSNKALFNKSNGGLIGNYSSGVFVPSQNINAVLDLLQSTNGRAASVDQLGEENYTSVLHCLQYCLTHTLHLMEASDLVVPFSGESNTYPPNLRASHLKNIDNHDNNAKNKKIGASPAPEPKKGFWRIFKK